jgi:hypothetical protein
MKDQQFIYIQRLQYILLAFRGEDTLAQLLGDVFVLRVDKKESVGERMHAKRTTGHGP